MPVTNFTAVVERFIKLNELNCIMRFSSRATTDVTAHC